ncbi:P-loop containing nucleoside triphosphate hydrolase [Arabidopsis suecica]|uniref:P-loop containing nucleoside triphosphate hydrolase n=1 Tax=Arabidopsis suecica TaxID=45249 RepID=A0A8T2C8C4_ARASU|nr:P-loop containing nucleoside triphosphate hydrolase [Arabidopsis suecica]
MNRDGAGEGDSVSHEPSTSKSPKEVEETKKEEKSDEKAKTVPFYKLFAFADSFDVLLMICGSIGAIGNGVCLPLMTLLFGDLIDSFGKNQNNKDIVDVVSKVCLKFVYLGLGTLGAAFLQVACWMITGERQAARIRSTYLKTILRQDIGFFDLETNTGEVVGRMSGDTVLIQDAMGEKVGKFIQLVSTFVGGFVLAFIKGWLLTLVMLTSIPLLAMAGAAMAIIVTRASSRGQAAYAKAATVVEQTIGSIRTVASFTGEKQAINSYKKFITSAYKSSIQQGFSTGLGLGVMFFVFFSSYALAIWFGGKMILEKGYTGGAVINVIIIVVAGSMSLGQTSPCVTAFAAGQAAAYKMFETIKRKPLIDAYDVNGKVLEDIRGDIELKDVHFSYPARPDEDIFNGFSLFIPSGATAALVGESGSGKSTVISLIERFYDPKAGEILIDGVNLKEFQLKWIRSKIGLVSQEPVLFSSSIMENIAYGKENATVEEIKAATELANAAKFIDKLPQGLDTMVGEHGTQLSGGQKQRIAIARAILKDPRILLLDEATSALDAESERVVQEALDRVMVNRTTVIVAHRLSTVRNADMIAVIHRGKMVEKGSHSELLKDSEGAYSQLIRLQEINKGNDVKPSDISAGSSFRNSSLKKSIEGSVISGGTSSVGNSSRHHSLNVLGLFAGLDLGSGSQRVGQEETGTASQEPLPKVSLTRIAALNKPEIPVLLLGTVAAAINGVIFPLFGILISRVIEAFFKPADQLKNESRFWAIIFVALGVTSLIVSPSQMYLFAVAGGKLIRRIQSMCFEKAVHMEVGWFDEPENSSGTMGARLSTDAALIRALVGDALSLAVQNAASAASGLIIAFTASWELALIILLMLPLIGINGFLQVKFMKGFSADAKSKYEEASQVANDAVGSIRTVASFCAEEKVMQMYKKQCEGPIKDGIKQGFISGLGFGFSFFILFCFYATSFYAAARLVEDGRTTFIDVFQVFFALTMAAIGVSQSSTFAPDSSKAKAAAASIFAIIDRKSKIDSSEESGTVLENVKGDIDLRHLSFTYPARPDIQIFCDLCLTIRAGKTVALVGESGSGKSTVISLLQRFYDPDSGHITLDGVELKKLQLKWLRQRMGLVGQEPVLFNDTIRANIAYGKGSEDAATEAEIIAAAELANAHKFISSIQQGYDTVVGERGIQLSGGQKQRVALARAIVKEPKILLLDEATSALDAESERVVQDALDRVMVNRTTVVVAHRLSTIKNADVIAVVKNGVIAEKGTHGTLIKIDGGVYASLVQLHMTASN